MVTEKTLVMIKPEGMKHRVFIHHRLSQHGLLIGERRFIVLTESMIEGLYPDIPPAIRVATMDHLKGKEVEVLVVQGENAIKTIINEVGDHKNPEDCDVGSIRSLLADRTMDKNEIRTQITPRLAYHKNFIHRSNGPLEVEVQAKLFGIKLN